MLGFTGISIYCYRAPALSNIPSSGRESLERMEARQKIRESMAEGSRGPDGAGTLASTVYRQLRHDIVKGILTPGEKLRIESLRDRYGVGGSPIREALNRLCSEGLVSQRDQRGFCVAPVSVDDLQELLRTRCWVNEIALREAIARGDEAWEEAIVLAFHRLLRTPERLPDAPDTPNPEWEQRHRTFHSALIAACDSHWLRGFAEMLFDCADRYRHLSGHVRAQPQRDIAGEHRAIMEATINRDTATAVRLLNEHAILTAELLRQSPGMLQAATE